jgi:hypothetical protein
MTRIVVLLTAAALSAGCQTQNPYAAFGPGKVPPPTTSQPPYYPPAAGPRLPSSASSGASPRLSVSAEGPSGSPSRSTFAADAGDREPIRIVENPATTARTASVPARVSSPANTQPAPPPGSIVPQSSPQPSRAPPAKSSGISRIDAAVKPAGYQQPAGAFVETPSASGGWRAR